MFHFVLFIGPLEGTPLVIGLVVTFVVLWQSRAWIKGLVSVVIFMAVAKACGLAGIHKCMEGQPPAMLGYAFGMVAALLPWVLAKWRWSVPVAFAVVGMAGVACSGYLAESYHRPEIMGNPAYGSGRFWHTPLTGQLPRDVEKMKAFAVPSHPE